MANSTDKSSRGAVTSRAQAVFTASEQRDALVRQLIDKERAATDAKTAKLRALRLAKEAEEAAHAAANPPPPKAKKKTKAKA